jgi:two-component system, OmpR family, response regulator CpxR
MQRAAHSILVVEDDAELAALMTEYFAQFGFVVETAGDGRAGLARALEGSHDIVILDAMLPALDGFEVLRQLRKRSIVPVIMLTARVAQPDRIAGLNAGADDYLPKPFGPEELLARIRAVLRRTARPLPADQSIEASGLRLDPEKRIAAYHGEPLEVTAFQFDILEVLVRAAGRTVSRDELAAALHQRPASPFERSLDVHISHLRRKLEREGRTPIRTVRGAGYQFAK